MKLELEWVEIPGGTFSAGIKYEESLRLSSKYKSDVFFREVPEKIINVATFWITKYPITNRQFKSFSEATHSHATPIFMGCSDETLDHPVRFLSYYDAIAFCQWVSCRLPTQTEWEKAASGPNGLFYPWGNEWNPAYCNNLSLWQNRRCQTTPVGNFPQGASPYGVMDMSGNVWELTNTTYVSNLNTQIQDAQLIDSQDVSNLESYMDDVSPIYEERVVLKGGAATSNFIGIRNSFQYTKHSFKQSGDFVGFRCVKM